MSPATSPRLAAIVLGIVLLASVPGASLVGSPSAAEEPVDEHAAGAAPCPDPDRGDDATPRPDRGGGAADEGAGQSIASASASPVASAVLLATYSRWNDSDPLAHETRATIHDELVAAPGTYVDELRERTDIPRSTLRYHLRVLEDEGIVRAEKLLGHRRYYPADCDDDTLAAALDSEATAAVVDAVARLEPASVSALATDLDRAPSTVSYHLDRLAEADVVDRERDGEVVLTRLSDDARAELGPERRAPRPV